MLRFAKVATPLTAATVVVPERVPLAGLVPIATVMLVVAVVTVVPWASWTATCTGGLIAAPGAAVRGCPAKTSFVAVGWTGPEVLPEHPPSATPHSATPTQNPPRASIQRFRTESHMIPRKVGLGGLGKGVRRPLLFRLKAQNQKPATWVSPPSRFRDSLPSRALASRTTSRLG